MKKAIIFLTGGFGYGAIEILSRGYTHWSMILTGGICVVGLCEITQRVKFMPAAAALGAVMITAIEFFVGAAVNLLGGMAVWDYSREWGNVLGQICPRFTLYWFLLCLVFFDVRLILLHLRKGKGPIFQSAPV